MGVQPLFNLHSRYFYVLVPTSHFSATHHCFEEVRKGQRQQQTNCHRYSNYNKKVILNEENIMDSPNYRTNQTANLAEFDPFSPGGKTKKAVDRNDLTSLIFQSVSPPSNGKPGVDEVANIDRLRRELMNIATHLEQGSPKPPITVRSESKSSPHTSPGSDALSLSQNRLETLNRKSKSSSVNSTTSRNPFASFVQKTKRNRNESNHHKSKALVANTKLWHDVQESLPEQAKIFLTDSPVVFSRKQFQESPSNVPQGMDAAILQDVWKDIPETRQQDNTRQNTPPRGGHRHRSRSPRSPFGRNTPTSSTPEQPEASLYIPNLAKMRPTSFLTSEQAAAAASGWNFGVADWRKGAPSRNDYLVAARIAQFLDTYRTQECLLDLDTLKTFNRMQLVNFASGDNDGPHVADDYHRPVVEALLDAAGDDFAQVRGYFHSKSLNLEERREALVLEFQRTFLVVMRGSTSEQHQGASGSQQQHQQSITLEMGRTAAVTSCYLQAVIEGLEAEVFQLLDSLTDSSPFCDITFTGHSFGAGMALVASFLYAHTRCTQRCGTIVTACPKVIGGEYFSAAVNARANLKVFRLDYPKFLHQQQYCKWNTGHSIRLMASSTDKKALVPQLVYLEDEESSKSGKSFFGGSKKDPTPRPIQDFVSALEGMSVWVDENSDTKTTLDPKRRSRNSSPTTRTTSSEIV